MTQNTSKKTFSWNFGLIAQLFIAVCLLAAGFYAGSVYNTSYQSLLTDSYVKKWDAKLNRQADLIKYAHSKAQKEIEALTVYIANLQTRLVRLETTGQLVVDISGLEGAEFDFRTPIGQGGPNTEFPEPLEQPDFMVTLAKLENQIDRRRQELVVLESLIDKRKIRESTLIAGKPVKKGWLTSGYGMRTDPVSGRRRMHSGIDFAGSHGTEILAVAAGIVTSSEYNSGYGNFVEITHPGGFKTKYAHNSQNIVTVGDIVQKGETIAYLGSTGKSTGPHVHFEIRKNGKKVNPADYLNLL